MFEDYLSHLDALLHQLRLLRWTDWIVPAVGLLTFGFVLRIVCRKRSRHPFLVSHPHDDPFQLCVSERRHFARWNGEPVGVLIVCPQSRAPAAHGQVIDRSLDGLRLSVPRRVRTGTLLRIRRDGDEGNSAWIELQVKHCRQEKEQWVLGGQFHAAPSCRLPFD